MRRRQRIARTRRLIHRNSILISHGIICFIVAIDIIYDRSSTLAAKISLGIFLLLIALLGIARYLNLFKINSRPLVHVILYYLLISTGLILFARIGSTFAYAWLLVLFFTYFYYGLRATLGSLLILAMVLELQLLFHAYQTGLGITKGSALTVFVQFGVILMLAMFFVDTETASEHEQRVLSTSIDKVQLEHQRIISLINSMNDGVVATDESGHITLYNAAALNILDTNQNLSGKPLNQYFHLRDIKGNKVDILKISQAENRDLQSTDYLFRYNKDEQINLGLTVSQVKVGFQSDDERGFIITFRDITREKSLEEERDEFISVVSHELRTPVAITEANISNAMFLADKNQDIEAVKSGLKAAHVQVLYLASMLNDLSTLSRAERGKLDLNPEVINIRSILESLSHDYGNQASSKGLTLTLDVADSTPETIVSNGLYLREILQNFLTNSIKYTREGSVILSSEGTDKGVRFTVKDTGIGISKSDLKKVFLKFFRSEDYRTRESSGTGLGLYITKKLAKIIGAEFEVSSELNKGSSFGIVVPNLHDQLPKSE